LRSSEYVVTPDKLTKSIGELRRVSSRRSIGGGGRFIAKASHGSTPPETLVGHEGHAPVQPFVGRAVELGRLGDWFAKAHAGERQIVFVSGSPGIGKTRLVEAFLDSAAIRGALPSVRIARGSCVEQRGPREPYMPVLEALERLARQPESAPLVPLLRRVAPTWLAQMPWLAGEDAEALRHSLQAARADRMLPKKGPSDALKKGYLAPLYDETYKAGVRRLPARVRPTRATLRTAS
jgi:hypothetical protein